MKKICFIFLVLLVSYVTDAFAQGKTSEEYIIQKGDTLWDISNSKLQDSFLWPKLWDVNPHISNPDLIYPGEKIIIPSREELMQHMAPPEQEEKQIAQEPATSETPALEEPPAKKAPQAVKKPKTAQAVQPTGKPLSEMKAYKKFLIDKNRYISLGWISKEFPSIGEIISTPSGRAMSGNDDIVYVNFFPEKMSSDQGLKEKSSLAVAQNEDSKSRFLAIRDIKEVSHPVTGDKLGHLIRVTGILELAGFDKDTPKAKVIRSYEEVHVGDGLIPYEEMDPPVAPDVIRTPPIDGYIIESLYTHELSGDGDVVFLDKGQDDGLKAGDVFSVLSNSPVQRVIGKLQVISMQPTTSASIILESDGEVLLGSATGQK